MRRRGGDAQRGRPWRLPLEDRLLLLAKYWRTNLTLQQVAPIFRGSKPTVNRVLHHLALLAISPTRGPRKDAVYIVDGTLAPTHDRSVAKSSKNYRYSTNLQVVIDANSRQGNKHGHILELEEQRGDAAAKNFHWKLLPVCGAPRTPRRTSPASTSPRSARSPARTAPPSTSTTTCGSPQTGPNWASMTASSPSPSTAPNGGT